MASLAFATLIVLVACHHKGASVGANEKGHELAEFEARYHGAMEGYSLREENGELWLLTPSGATRDVAETRLSGAHHSVQLVYSVFRADALSGPLSDSALGDVVKADATDSRLDWLPPAVHLVEDLVRRTQSRAQSGSEDAQEFVFFDELLRQNPGGSIENAIMAYRYALVRQREKAVALIEKSMGSANCDDSTFVFLGAIYSIMGEPSHEKEVYLRGLKLFPESVDLQLAIARVHGELAEWEEASGIYRILRERNPDNPEYEMHLKGLEKLMKHEKKDRQTQ